MANKIRIVKDIYFDTEKHTSGLLCWCRPVLDDDGVYIHRVSFDHGVNVNSPKDIRA